MCELTGRQRLELALLEEDAEVAAKDYTSTAYRDALAVIVRYVRAEVPPGRCSGASATSARRGGTSPRAAAAAATTRC
jgi:hypothetical protein